MTKREKKIAHFKTITHHKREVFKACAKCGIPWQGLVHDLSKFSRVEFTPSAMYFQGDRSPITAQKEEIGYSIAWQNHKAKNKHHWQYWTDFEKGQIITIRIPPKYLVEMICDWVGAGKAYNKDSWTIDSLKGWYSAHKDTMYLHNTTRRFIDFLMAIASNEDDLYRYLNIKKVNFFYMMEGPLSAKKEQARYDLTVPKELSV